MLPALLLIAASAASAQNDLDSGFAAGGEAIVVIPPQP
jgi:hypothetical protein